MADTHLCPTSGRQDKSARSIRILEGNEGAPAQDLVLVGSVVGYAVARHQDCDRDVHNAAAAPRPSSALSWTIRRSQVRLFWCEGKPSKAALYLPPAEGVCTAGIHPMHPERPARA